MRRISSVSGFGFELLAVQPLGQRIADGLLVADGGELGVADHLRLEAVGQDVVDVVIDQVAGDGAAMRFSASRMSPVAPYFFLMARISSSVRWRKRSSNLVSKPCLSLSAVSAVRPS